MRILLILILITCMLKASLAQSPFNYGKNKKIYFISKELRSKLKIDSIFTVDHTDETGGMGENWNVTKISFGENAVTDEWYRFLRTVHSSIRLIASQPI